MTILAFLEIDVKYWVHAFGVGFFAQKRGKKSPPFPMTRGNKTRLLKILSEKVLTTLAPDKIGSFFKAPMTNYAA
jgi:hypothetical protein